MGKQYIKATMQTDLNAYNAFRCCGYLNRDMLHSLGVSDRRIAGHEHDKHWEHRTMFNSSTRQNEDVWTWTKSGAKFMADKIDREHTGWYRSASASHDLGLATRYLQLKEEERATWTTESEYRDQFRELVEREREAGEEERAKELEDMLANREISPPDGGYTTAEGVEIAVEIITDHYGQAEIQAKESFVEVMELKEEFWKV